MDCKINLELGTLTVADEVIATVAGNTCVECYGIVGMGTKRATDGIVEMFKKDSLTKGVKVVAGEGSVSISVSVVLEYGVSMQAVSKAVIDNIKYNIETMIGVKVEKINVIVVGIRV
ncbi:MAG: Asp23/Gls24 family envelope stress response protein [Christensenellales bacterium]